MISMAEFWDRASLATLRSTADVARRARDPGTAQVRLAVGTVGSAR